MKIEKQLHLRPIIYLRIDKLQNKYVYYSVALKIQNNRYFRIYDCLHLGIATEIALRIQKKYMLSNTQLISFIQWIVQPVGYTKHTHMSFLNILTLPISCTSSKVKIYEKCNINKSSKMLYQDCLSYGKKDCAIWKYTKLSYYW